MQSGGCNLVWSCPRAGKAYSENCIRFLNCSTLLFLSSRQHFLLRCWIELSTFFQQSDVVSYLVFQILLYLKLKTKYSYPAMSRLLPYSPPPGWQTIGLVSGFSKLFFFFFLHSHSQQHRNAPEANHWPFRPKYSSPFPVLRHHIRQPLHSHLWLLG